MSRLGNQEPKSLQLGAELILTVSVRHNRDGRVLNAE